MLHEAPVPPGPPMDTHHRGSTGDTFREKPGVALHSRAPISLRDTGPTQSTHMINQSVHHVLETFAEDLSHQYLKSKGDDVKYKFNVQQLPPQKERK